MKRPLGRGGPKVASPVVSVVIIGRNEALRLPSCLESIARINRVGFSVQTIYVDSGSTDKSMTIAKDFGVQTIELNSIRPTAAMGRNVGWRAALGDFILFLDGDTILDASFIAEAIPFFDAPRVAVVWGHRRETLATPTLYNRILDLDWIYPVGESAFCGGDAIMRREVLQAAGGYDESLIAGEEPELCRRIRSSGWSILHVDLPMTRHDLGIRRFRQYWKRSERAGHAFAEVSARFAASGDPMWLADSKGNWRKAGVLVTVVCAGLSCGVTARSVEPLFLCLGFLLLLVLRTAWKARWKSTDPTTLLLYGVHSHFQQIPIAVGQAAYWLNSKRGRPAQLMDYKPR